MAESGLTSGDPAVLSGSLISLIILSDALLLSGCDILDEGGDVGVELAGNGGEVDNGVGSILVLALPGLVVNSVGNVLRVSSSERGLQASVGSARILVGLGGPGLKGGGELSDRGGRSPFSELAAERGGFVGLGLAVGIVAVNVRREIRLVCSPEVLLEVG